MGKKEKEKVKEKEKSKKKKKKKKVKSSFKESTFGQSGFKFGSIGLQASWFPGVP